MQIVKSTRYDDTGNLTSISLFYQVPDGEWLEVHSNYDFSNKKFKTRIMGDFVFVDENQINEMIEDFKYHLNLSMKERK